MRKDRPSETRRLPEVDSLTRFYLAHGLMKHPDAGEHVANVADIDLTAAVVEKYGSGCPGCGHLVCTCNDAEKP